jgi:hypothetical protein
MKKLFTLLLTSVIVINSFAQDKPAVSTDKNVLKVNALSVFLGTGSVFYEHKFSDNISGQLGVAYLGLKLGDTKFSGLILTPEFRFYPKKNAIDGMYIAPYLRYQNFTLQSGDNKGTLSTMGGGLLFGRQWITNSGFTMDLFFGGHYSGSKVKVTSGTDTFDSDRLSGFGVRIGFALGFAF